jgi:hypothetical protein
MKKKEEKVLYGFNVIVFEDVSEEDYSEMKTPYDKFWQYNPAKKEFIIEK